MFPSRDVIKELIKYKEGHSDKFSMTMNHHLIDCFPPKMKKRFINAA